MEKISFLVDENVEFSVVKYLRAKKFDVFSIAETVPSLDDTSILKLATTQKRIIITSDKDFGNLIFKIKLSSAGIILFRMDDQSARRKIEIIDVLLQEYLGKISGNFLVISDSKIRIRKI